MRLESQADFLKEVTFFSQVTEARFEISLRLKGTEGSFWEKLSSALYSMLVR